jgi:tetratricopeptide (TPR) repeat protein
LSLGAAPALSQADARPAQPQRATSAAQGDPLARAKQHFTRARKAYADGQLEEAHAEFSEAYALSPSAELAYNLARVLERMGRPEQSAAYYRIYARAAEGLTDAEHTQIEQRLLQLDALAERQHGQALKPPPTDGELAAEARTFFTRGAKLFARGKLEDALVAFGAAQRFAALPELSYNMALTEERLGDRRAAVDHYRAYLRAARNPADAEQVRKRIASLTARLDQTR